MRPEQFYQEIGGSYQEALTRMPDDRRIVRYLGMFLQDPSMEELGKALTAGDAEEAFRMAHALKGTCLTLGLGRLTVRASELTEMDRQAGRGQAGIPGPGRDISGDLRKDPVRPYLKQSLKSGTNGFGNVSEIIGITDKIC